MESSLPGLFATGKLLSERERNILSSGSQLFSSCEINQTNILLKPFLSQPENFFL